jgi:hypothetical protein
MEASAAVRMGEGDRDRDRASGRLDEGLAIRIAMARAKQWA